MKKYLLLFFLFSCTFSNQNKNSEVIRVSSEDFENETQVPLQLKEGFSINLWAPGPLLSNAVAISFDNHGTAYISETTRRKTSDLDIRAHKDWIPEDIGLQSLDDTRAFHLAKLDPSLSDQNQWQPDFNQDSIHDWQDLMVQSERVRRIWDHDGDGRADASAIYAEGFNEMLTGIAAGVLSYDEDVYLTVAPDLWKLTDHNQDGVADERVSLSHGYGIHIAYAGHDMSGLVMGPDGKIYWSIGDIGVNVLDANGKQWTYPHEGAVMRINPDGTEFEVFAHGLRNPQELAFDAYGNLISVDNDGDHKGEHERFVHILEGSDAGWRMYWQFGKYNQPNESYKVWTDEKLHFPHFSGQAAYITPPIALAPDGPSGLAYNPGTALGGQWENYFFASYFTGSSANSRVQAFKLTPRGASFALANADDVLLGVVPTGMAFGPDGALYINDWKDGYKLKPEGRIWKLDLRFSDMQELRVQTEQILKEGMKNRNVVDLQKLLGHRDMRVRMAAQFELVKRKEAQILITEAKAGKNQFSRLHAIWGMGQLARKGEANLKELENLLNDRNDWIRTQTAKIMGEARYSPAKEQLIKQLQDDFAHAQYYAVEALGKIGDQTAFQPLVDVLAQIEETDPHLRHGIVMALARIGDVAAIKALHKHPSEFVRIGATVALRELKSSEVAIFLNDEHGLVVTEAARAIHDDFSIPEALPSLAEALHRVEIKEEAFVRRAINANLRFADQRSAERLVGFAINQAVETEMRTDALWALGYWGNPPQLDRVEGRSRKLPSGNIEEAGSALKGKLSKLLSDKNPLIRSSALRLIGRLKLKEKESTVFSFLNNRKQPSEVRTTALMTLGQLSSQKIEDALKIALADADQNLRKTALSQLGELPLSPESVVNLLDQVLKNGQIPEKQKALASLGKLHSPEAEALLDKWLTMLTDGTIAPELQLDVMMAVEGSAFEKLKIRKYTYETDLKTKGLLTEFAVSLQGGDSKRGNDLFYKNNSAQCIRCHRIDGNGGEVGPELTGIATVLSPENLLLSLIEPNARLAPGYGTVEVILNDGTKVVGVLEQENEDAITLKIASGKSRKINMADIKERKNYPSGMFSMKEVLSKKELRDLMAYLIELK